MGWAARTGREKAARGSGITIKKRYNDQDDGELRDLSGCANVAEERVRAAYQDNRYLKVQVVGELMPAQKSKADGPVTIVVSVLR